MARLQKYISLRKISLFLLLIGLSVSLLQAQQLLNSDSADAVQYRNLLNQYCVSCHNQALKTAGLMLDKANILDLSQDPELWERVITKLTLRAMPPVGIVIRPNKNQYEGLIAYLQDELDSIAQQSLDPGSPTIHRLNRSEYANAIRDLLGLEIDAESILPPDNLGDGFDNIAEILSVSPLLMERYMFAAGRISRMAVGPSVIQPASETYNISSSYRQNTQMSEELPFGSRGGTAIYHYFPQDGDYTLKIDLERNIEGYIRGLRNEHTIDVRLNHKSIGMMEVGGKFYGRSGPIFTENQVTYYSGDQEQVGYEFTADEKLLVRFSAESGNHLIGVAFIDESIKPSGIFQPELPLADIYSYKGGDTEVASVTITGPFDGKVDSQTASREKIFTCNPIVSGDEICAKEILSKIARRAYRRPVTKGELDEMVDLFQAGQQDDGFDSGIELVLQSILAGPEFLFRIEKGPLGSKPEEIYAVSDIDLASRLSFFLWSSIPDEELLEIAEQGKLRDPGILKEQVYRMIEDPRFEAFTYNFGRQWLGLRDVDNSDPNLEIFPEFDEELRQAFKQEIILWFQSMVRRDQSILEILTSDYTYVNERLARHYGIPDIYGSRFRPIELTSYKQRKGLFGKGGLLMGTAFNNRTSPVLRGKWVLENLLNMPPPPPPDDVPALRVEDDSGKAITLKQAMEKHRANPVCSSCHKLMDPIGFALENFDAVGSFRSRYADADAVVDSSGVLFDGGKFSNSEEFRSQFLQYSSRMVHTVTEKVLNYALGRKLEYYDQSEVRNIVNRLEDEDFSWSSLILGVIESRPFQYRRVNAHDNI